MRVYEGYKDNTYRAQCDLCGCTTWRNMLVEQELNPAPGGAPKHIWVCPEHRDPHHPQADIGLRSYEDPRTGDVVRSDKILDSSYAIPIPVVTSIVPSTATTAGFLASPGLTVNGSGFSQTLPQSIIRWDGTILPTAYVSATQLTTTVYLGLITTGTHLVDVLNQGPPFIAGPPGPGLAPTSNLSNQLSMVLT